MTGLVTLENEAPGLAGSPSSPGLLPRRRWPLVAVAAGLLIAVLALVALTSGQSAGGALDPRSAAPGGTRALAALLRDRGVSVQRGAEAGPSRTVLVPFPEALTSAALAGLLASGADVVLVDPGFVADAQLTPTGGLHVRTRAPQCQLPAALTAGPVRLGGTSYSSANSAIACYDGALLVLPTGSTAGGGRVTVLGSSDFLTNERLDQQGNAALALGLLSDHQDLTWYVARRNSDGASLTSLLPAAIPWAMLQLAIAVIFIGVWRGRRLGPVVTEPLPVVVRAAETVLGRARLYAAARARATAADAIRAGCRARLATLVHLEPTASPGALVSAVAGRSRADAQAVAALLYGDGGYGSTRAAGTVESDAALVRLAGDLDQLEREVSRQ